MQARFLWLGCHTKPHRRHEPTGECAPSVYSHFPPTTNLQKKILRCPRDFSDPLPPCVPLLVTTGLLRISIAPRSEASCTLRDRADQRTARLARGEKNRAEGRPVMLLRRLRKIALALAGEFRDFGSPPCAPSPEAAGWVGRGPSARDKRMEGRGKLGWHSAVRSIARPRPYSGIADTFWTRRLSPRRPFLSAPQLQLPIRFLACFVRAMLLHIQSMCPGICEAT